MDTDKDPAGDREERVSRLIGDYKMELLRLCFIYLGDVSLAEDAVQETFIKAYKGIRAFRGESKERTWLYRIAINVCKDMRRKPWFRMIRREVNLDDLQVVAQPQEVPPSALLGAILHLPRKDREIILMYYYEDMKLAEIAAAIGVSSATVCRRLDRARRLLKDLLEGQGLL